MDEPLADDDFLLERPVLIEEGRAALEDDEAGE
jgi:hypothetical protein